MYKNAIRSKMRVLTPKGELSIEKLFDLNMTDLKSTIIRIDKEINDSGSGLDFLDSTIDSKKQSQFDIVKDIYMTKKQDQENKSNTMENKKHNEEIMRIISQKKQIDLESKSIEELETLMRK